MEREANLLLMKIKDKKTRGFLAAVTGGICWGFSGCCGQYLFSEKGMDAGWLTVVRLLCAGALLLAFCALGHRKDLRGAVTDRGDLLRILLFGVLGMMLCQYSYMKAISLTNAATATVIQYTGPVLVTVVVCLRAMKLPTLSEVCAVALAVGGTFIVATHGDPRGLVLSAEGLLWCLFAAVSVVLYTLIPEKVIGKRSSAVVSGLGMTVGGIVLFFIVGAWKISPTLDAGAILALGAIIVVGTVLAFSLYLQAVSDIGPVRASVIASIEPVASGVISWLWLGQSFELIDILGFAMIISTVFVLAIRKNNA